MTSKFFHGIIKQRSLQCLSVTTHKSQAESRKSSEARYGQGLQKGFGEVSLKIFIVVRTCTSMIAFCSFPGHLDLVQLAIQLSLPLLLQYFTAGYVAIHSPLSQNKQDSP
jgi:hypothetical protein